MELKLVIVLISIYPIKYVSLDLNRFDYQIVTYLINELDLTLT